MATSKIKIYQTVLTPARNALVDDLDQYLSWSTLTYSNDAFQYIKLGLDLTIKINNAQNKISGHSLGNYVRIEQDNKVWYYFIMNTDWKSANTIELKLSIDSVNTFRNDLTWSDKTSIQREHEDRFYKQEGSNILIRRIDPEKEQINAEKTLMESFPVSQENKNFDWYLIYKTRDDLSPSNPNNPIHCYTIASEPLTISKSSSESQVIRAGDLLDNHYYYFTDIDNPGGIATVDSKTFNLNTEGQKMIMLQKEGTKVKYTWYESGFAEVHTSTNHSVYHTNTTAVFGTKQIGPTTSKNDPSPDVYPPAEIGYLADSITINVGNFLRDSTENLLPYGVYGTIKKATKRVNVAAGSIERKTITLKEVDKTDSRIVKIIKLPYAPCNITYNNGVYTFPSEWKYEAGYMKLNDASLSTEFENNIGRVYFPELFLTETAQPTQLKNFDRESKLYHSDFYNFKLVYDSFVREIALERIDTSDFSKATTWDMASTWVSLKFKPTNTINSKFAFKIDYSTWDEAHYFADYNKSFDYEDYLLVSRNNEETIFSNDYLNYIRTGYNYDKKAKARELQQQIGTSLVQAGSAAITYGLNPNVAISAAAAVSFGASAVNTLISIHSNKQQFENSMQSKLADLAAQSTAVMGSDDVDLLSYYNGNRLEIKKYDTISQQKEALYKLFFYCGYSHNVVAKPNIRSRYWFNFIQCKPVFNEEGATPYNDYLDDIKSRYEAGITVYHHHYDNIRWDWEQKYENWEVNFLPTDALNALMLSNLNIDDREGFSCFYTGPVVLDKSRYSVEFELYESGTVSGNPNLGGSTSRQRKSYEPYSTVRIPFEWQVKPGSLLRARIVDGKYEDQSSGWRTVIL